MYEDTNMQICLSILYVCKPSYWCNSDKDKVLANDIEIGRIQENRFGFEKDPAGLNAAISIQKITKVTELATKKSVERLVSQ